MHIHPGFTTKDEVSNFSGRGKGLDVVARGVSQINGSITIDSIEGKGTLLTIEIPLK